MIQGRSNGIGLMLFGLRAQVLGALVVAQFKFGYGLMRTVFGLADETGVNLGDTRFETRFVAVRLIAGSTQQIGAFLLCLINQGFSAFLGGQQAGEDVFHSDLVGSWQRLRLCRQSGSER